MTTDHLTKESLKNLEKEKEVFKIGFSPNCSMVNQCDFLIDVTFGHTF